MAFPLLEVESSKKPTPKEKSHIGGKSSLCIRKKGTSPNAIASRGDVPKISLSPLVPTAGRAKY
jgi:hypothetical protein